MDDAGYIKKHGEPQTLEEILMWCAFRLGQGGLEHRTLKYFNYFVSSLIFGKTNYEYFQKAYPTGNTEPDNELKSIAYSIQNGEAEDSLKIYEKYNSYYSTDSDHPLLTYAKLFKEYIEEEYKDDEGY